MPTTVPADVPHTGFSDAAPCSPMESQHHCTTDLGRCNDTFISFSVSASEESGSRTERGPIQGKHQTDTKGDRASREVRDARPERGGGVYSGGNAGRPGPLWWRFEAHRNGTGAHVEPANGNGHRDADVIGPTVELVPVNGHSTNGNGAHVEAVVGSNGHLSADKAGRDEAREPQQSLFSWAGTSRVGGRSVVRIWGCYNVGVGGCLRSGALGPRAH